MTFNGTWKVHGNDNYEKFMEQMGKWCCFGLSALFIYLFIFLPLKALQHAGHAGSIGGDRVEEGVRVWGALE